MSPKPDTPEDGHAHLRRAIANLPAHAPAPATWPRIEAQLAADEALARAVPALPQHEPAAALWGVIAARLDAAEPVAAQPSRGPVAQGPPAVVRPLWPARAGRRVLAVAASVLLVLGVWWQQRPAPGAPAVALHETLSFSEEPGAPAPALAPGPDPLDRQGQAFIDSHCSALPAVCQSGAFRSLRTQLAELETQQAQLRRDTRRFGTSPELLREQARLVTLHASITRELVQLLIS
ncbi:hypothetical protein [Hymenobacter sp. PAMC 26628]|uniref:hypothetical protein n=1 Tax=Hymenobacter sp. PAMC 26628 TaxID=1484118 RepID=UPI0007704BD2|nr:hypothetical protein [Hymenobacter sp. PAMC 26628]AMJ67648.1 hypothetical protein AXW84_21185 [Hymenobacter sp. PAMC 26628]